MKTVKVSVCAWCKIYIGNEVLTGSMALDGEDVIVSHGQCNDCHAAMAAEIEALDAPTREPKPLTVDSLLDQVFTRFSLGGE